MRDEPIDGLGDAGGQIHLRFEAKRAGLGRVQTAPGLPIRFAGVPLQGALVAHRAGDRLVPDPLQEVTQLPGRDFVLW